MSRVSVRDISLNYPIIGADNRSLKNQVLASATGGLISTGAKSPIVRALNNISLEICEGDKIGLVGHNGAGKSSFLKLLAGIYKPSKGSISVSGRVVSTLNLSLGMEPEATGFENIISRALLLGMKRKEIDEKLDEISAFTELGGYLSMPVRIYSSGMLTRLAFATVTAMDADILLMDEVIGTGDAAFIEKAEQRLNQFMLRSKILVLASHSEFMIRKFCNKAVLLEHGEIKAFGGVDEVFEQYTGGSA